MVEDPVISVEILWSNTEMWCEFEKEHGIESGEWHIKTWILDKLISVPDEKIRITYELI